MARLIDQMCVEDVKEYKEGQTTLEVEPKDWFKLQDHVNESAASRAICRVRAGGMGLGNRFPNSLGVRHTYCPLCATHGREAE